MLSHLWFSNAIPGDTNGFWCLHCKLVKLERRGGVIEYFYHLVPLSDKDDPNDCSKYRT